MNVYKVNNNHSGDCLRMQFLKRDHKGWKRTWEAIKAAYGDYACYDARSGESWQYMGSTDTEHQFRHRSLPGKDARENYSIPINSGDFDSNAP